MAARDSIRTHRGRDRLTTTQARAVGVAGFLAAMVLPLALWQSSIRKVADDFRFDLGYLVTGWVGYGLIALGLAFFVPVVVSIGRRPGERLYVMGRAAYAGWGASLYVLGMALASQVAVVTSQHPAG